MHLDNADVHLDNADQWTVLRSKLNLDSAELQLDIAEVHLDNLDNALRRRMHEWRDASGGDFKIATPLNARKGGVDLKEVVCKQQKLFLGKGNGDGHDTNFLHTYTKTDI